MYFEGVLKIYWGLTKPITLAPGVMYSKNRNSRASIYEFYGSDGLDDTAYLMMLEEAAKVRKRRELFEETKLHEIVENAWDSKGWWSVQINAHVRMVKREGKVESG